jgi:SAM-dependent methyltransferase
MEAGKKGYYEMQAAYYDAIYASQGKDYAAEAGAVRAAIEAHKKTAGNDLLDVACGTGGHLQYLKNWYTVEGLDLDANMLAIARQRHPGIVFHQGDMTTFDLGKEYDAVVCLFSAIGYVRTLDGLNAAIAHMARHVRPGGVLVVEPWFAPEQWQTGAPHATFVDKPDLKLARMNLSERTGDVSVIRFHFLIATPAGVEYFTETHELGLFTSEQYLAAFGAEGLRIEYDEEGITGRGLYVGSKAG